MKFKWGWWVEHLIYTPPPLTAFTSRCLRHDLWIYTNSWMPAEKPKAVIFIVHGDTARKPAQAPIHPAIQPSTYQTYQTAQKQRNVPTTIPCGREKRESGTWNDSSNTSGLGEYCDRYDPFAKEMTDAGYAVYSMDHQGHGRSGAPVNNTPPQHPPFCPQPPHLHIKVSSKRPLACRIIKLFLSLSR